MRKITIFFSLIILCFVAIFFATPYWTLYKIKQAVDQNNAEALSLYIDYPSLRNNLKPQIQQQIQHKLGVDHPDNQIEVWGAVVSENCLIKSWIWWLIQRLFSCYCKERL